MQMKRHRTIRHHKMDGDKGRDPPTEVQDPNPPENDSSTTSTDLVVGEKRKHTEKKKVKERHKKMKADKTANTINLDGEDFTLLIEALIKVAQEIFKKYMSDRRSSHKVLLTY